MTRYLPLLVAALLTSGSLLAQSRAPDFYNPHDTYNPNVEEYEWKELEAKIPPYPKDENLVEYPVADVGNQFQYFLDKASLSYQGDDVVRYTVVIKSARGAANVAFEGARCNTMEYKLYAFGNGKDAFREVKQAQWRPLQDRRHERYRTQLVKQYLCNASLTDFTPERTVHAIEQGWRIKGGMEFN